MQPLGLPVLPDVNNSAHSPLNSASCATTSVWHGGIGLSVSIRRHLHAIRRRHQQIGLRQLKLEGQFVGPDVRVDRNDRNPKRIKREPMQEEDRAIFKQQRNPRAASITGGRVFGAKPIDLGLERPVFDPESVRRVGQSRACRRQQEWRVRPPRGRGREGIGWRSIRVEAHCGHSSC